MRPDGTGVVTIPRGGAEGAARAFAQDHAEWLGKQLLRVESREVAPALAWRAGDRVWLRGRGVRLTVLVQGGMTRVSLEEESFLLRTGRPPEDLRPIVERHLRAVAKTELTRDTMRAADRLGLRVKRVTVRNQRTRWGSCSSKGAISLNWRLIQAPEWIKDYVIAHELIHLRHMNHSKRFWSALRAAFPECDAAERWLKRQGLAFGDEPPPAEAAEK